MGKAETVGKVGKPVERERKGMWGSVAIGVLVGLLVLLLGTFLAVLFGGCAEKYIVQLFGLDEWQKYEALKFLGIGMGGVVLALQAVIANKRAQAMGDAADAQASAADAQARATKEQATANKNTGQGQRQERLKNAIEHLGNASNSVRLGGAYELFHLAEDTEDRGQRQTVLDILCAHIRWTTREGKYRGHSGGDEIEYKDKYPSNPSEEIQSLLALLFVQEHKVFTGLDINLQGSCLNGSNLSLARLEKAHLERAELHEAHLEGAQLHEAHLEGAELHEAHLERAQLHEAHLEGAELYEAHLERAQLYGAHLAYADLHGAHLAYAELHWVDLEDAQLHGAILVGAQLHGAGLEDAELHGADLRMAQLHGADLDGAQLHGANLRMAQLHEANLRRAQLYGASSSTRALHGPFEAAINERIGKESDLSGAIFAGGLSRKDVASIGKGLPDEDAKRLREQLEAHIGPPESHELPENSGARIGAYTKEDAAQWIAKYKTTVSGGG